MRDVKNQRPLEEVAWAPSKSYPHTPQLRWWSLIFTDISGCSQIVCLAA